MEARGGGPAPDAIDPAQSQLLLVNPPHDGCALMRHSGCVESTPLHYTASNHTLLPVYTLQSSVIAPFIHKEQPLAAATSPPLPTFNPSSHPSIPSSYPLTLHFNSTASTSGHLSHPFLILRILSHPPSMRLL